MMGKNIAKILYLFVTVLISFSLFVNTAIALSNLMLIILLKGKIHKMLSQNVLLVES